MRTPPRSPALPGSGPYTEPQVEPLYPSAHQGPTRVRTTSSPALPGAHPVHDPGVEDHEEDVERVEEQQDHRLVVLEVAVPREADEAADGQRVEERVSRQGAPVEVQHLRTEGDTGSELEGGDTGSEPADRGRQSRCRTCGQGETWGQNLQTGGNTGSGPDGGRHRVITCRQGETQGQDLRGETQGQNLQTGGDMGSEPADRGRHGVRTCRQGEKPVNNIQKSVKTVKKHKHRATRR